MKFQILKYFKARVYVSGLMFILLALSARAAFDATVVIGPLFINDKPSTYVWVFHKSGLCVQLGPIEDGLAIAGKGLDALLQESIDEKNFKIFFSKKMWTPEKSRQVSEHILISVDYPININSKFPSLLERLEAYRVGYFSIEASGSADGATMKKIDDYYIFLKKIKKLHSSEYIGEIKEGDWSLKQDSGSTLVSDAGNTVYLSYNKSVNISLSKILPFDLKRAIGMAKESYGFGFIIKDGGIIYCTKVFEGSIAEKAGLKTGDIFRIVGHDQPFESVTEFSNYAFNVDKLVLLLVNRTSDNVVLSR